MLLEASWYCICFLVEIFYLCILSNTACFFLKGEGNHEIEIGLSKRLTIEGHYII